MKVRIEIDPEAVEPEVLIRCAEITADIGRLQRLMSQVSSEGVKLAFHKGNDEYYFPLAAVLFFESSGDAIYAHTRDDDFQVRQRLYELEDQLPADFVRISKSCIVNTRQIYAIERNLASSSQVRFTGSHKTVYVSRRYYGACKARMEARLGS
ncbi:MAG: LytTR family transcriptional regulator [Actinomycetia bacterium]|nr:LytTR family transcriptional regulator [Actinomycetes bacterium]